MVAAAAAPARAATRRRRRAACSITPPSTDFCSALPRRRWRRSTITHSAGMRPYALISVPVVLGTIGGIGLVVGPIGLMMLQAEHDPTQNDTAHRDMNAAFILMLFLTGATGLLLLALRDTAAMGMLLAIHLGVVMGLFLSLPYGKFVHGLYRFLALVKYAGERRH